MAEPTISRSQLSRMIDHSVLSPQAGLAELEAGCQVARTYAVASLCVKPYYVRPAARRLAGSGVMVGATVGFPHGAHLPAVQAAEAAAAFADGADEVDMVINIGALRDGDVQLVQRDIQAVVAVAGGHCVKVILECALLDDAPLKQGRFTPGKHIPILHPDVIYERKPDVILVLAWNFAESIMKKHSQFKGKWIVPIPELKEYDA